MDLPEICCCCGCCGCCFSVFVWKHETEGNGARCGCFNCIRLQVEMEDKERNEELHVAFKMLKITIANEKQEKLNKGKEKRKEKRNRQL